MMQNRQGAHRTLERALTASRFRDLVKAANRQPCLIVDRGGGPCGIGDAAVALAFTYDHDHVRPGFAEMREDQIQIEEGRGQIHRRMRRLIFCATISSVIGEIERSLHNRRSSLTQRRSFDGDGLVMIPVPCAEEAGNEAGDTEGRNSSGALGAERLRGQP